MKEAKKKRLAGLAKRLAVFLLVPVMLMMMAGECHNKNEHVNLVIFYSNGGTGSMDVQTITDGTKLTPNAFTRAGYKFSGWNDAADGSGQYSFQDGADATSLHAVIKMNGNITLYAQWVPEDSPDNSNSGGGNENSGGITVSYLISFNSMGGSNVQAQRLKEGAKVTKPGDPTYADHTFTGWFTDRDCTKAYDFSKTVGSAMTLYAGWTDDKAAGDAGNDSSGSSDSSGGSGTWHEAVVEPVYEDQPVYKWSYSYSISPFWSDNPADTVSYTSDAAYDTKDAAAAAAQSAVAAKAEAMYQAWGGGGSAEFNLADFRYTIDAMQVQTGTQQVQTGTRVVREAGYY